MNVEYINHMGDDNSIVDAARVSFDKQAKNYTPEQNMRLIRYLAKHNHEIPFAHTAITLRVTAPIAIRTQCFKHKVGFVESEISRRYVHDNVNIFIPEFRRAAEDKKQGSLDELHIDNDFYKSVYEAHAKYCVGLYQQMIDSGVAPEQARFILPQGTETTWVWTGSLLAFARFYRLRSSEAAQKEVRDLAEQVKRVVQRLFPISWAALTGEDNS